MKNVIEVLNGVDLQVFSQRGQDGKPNGKFTVYVTDPATGTRYFLNRVQDASKLNPDGTPGFAWARGQEVQARAATTAPANGQ